MKKAFLILILFFALSIFTNAQNCSDITDCNLKLDRASQQIEKLLDLDDANKTALEAQKKQIEAFEKLVSELEKASRTPCTIAADKVKNDLVFWLAQLETADETRRHEVQKILKDTRKQGKKMLASQCGFSSESQFVGWLKVVVPFGIGLLF